MIYGALVLLLAALAGGFTAGRAWVQSDWDAERAALAQRERADAERRRLAAEAAAADFENERAALDLQLRSSQHALRKALRAPIQCPASGQLGDLVLPGGALDGVRDASRLGADRAAAGQRDAGL